jgi:hypothetical protein
MSTAGRADCGGIWFGFDIRAGRRSCVVLVEQVLAVVSTRQQDSMLCAKMLLLGPTQAVGLQQLLCWHVSLEVCFAAIVFCS